jgi:NADP-dependent 3-hydroxy acid dehydrogenase YdfG
MSLTEKVIVVSGCTKGIGFAISKLFAEKGFSVAGYARNQKDINEMQASFTSLYPGQTFLFIPADAAIKAEVLAFAKKVNEQFKGVDVLINNAGTFLPGSIMEETDGLLENLMATNVYSAYYLTRELQPILKRNVFNICSIASLQAYANGASYTISKFALLGFSKQLRHELTDTNIKVTSVMPGAVLTNSWAGVDLPESRFIQADDIAKIIYNTYELSDGADIEELVIRPQLGDI